MERRDFLRILPVPLVAAIEGKQAVAARMEGSHYLLFVDPVSVNLDGLLEGTPNILPKNAVITIVPVRLYNGQTMDDAVRLYEVRDAGS